MYFIQVFKSGSLSDFLNFAISGSSLTGAGTLAHAHILLVSSQHHILVLAFNIFKKNS